MYSGLSPTLRGSTSSSLTPIFLSNGMFSYSLPKSVVTFTYSVITLLSVVSCGSAYSDVQFSRSPVAGIDVKTLVPYLSPASKIYLPGSTEFTTHTVRWSNLEPPTPNVVIVPGIEGDVAKIVSSENNAQLEDSALTLVAQVKFAAERNIPFLVYNGHHGTLTTLGRMDYGIQIYLPELNTISISEDKKSVTVGGGTNSKALIDVLWEAGKQTGRLE